MTPEEEYAAAKAQWRQYLDELSRLWTHGLTYDEVAALRVKCKAARERFLAAASQVRKQA